MRSLVPAISADIRCKKTFRYISTAGVSTPLKVTDFLTALCMNYDGGTLWVSLCSAVRILRVDIYDLGGSTDVALSTIKWSWESNQGPTNYATCSGSPIYPGALSLVPPKESLASQWMSNQTNSATGNAVIARCVVPVSCYLDLTMELALQDQGSTGISQGGASGSVGQIGLRRLDKSGSGLLQSISMLDAQ